MNQNINRDHSFAQLCQLLWEKRITSLKFHPACSFTKQSTGWISLNPTFSPMNSTFSFSLNSDYGSIAENIAYQSTTNKTSTNLFSALYKMKNVSSFFFFFSSILENVTPKSNYFLSVYFVSFLTISFFPFPCFLVWITDRYTWKW